MIVRTSTTNPTNMLTSPYYNEVKYCGSGGYYKGNNSYQCVNYAVARTCEISGRAICYYSGISTKDQIDKPMFNRSGYGNAYNWLKDTLWKIGTTPKVGAIMVYGVSYGGGLGHVRVVEKIEGNKIFYSAANENKQMAFKWINIPAITSSGFMGYIYNPYVGEEMLLKFKKDDNYEYKWSVDGNHYGEPYDVTTERGFADIELEADGWELLLKVNGSLFYNYGDAYYACGLEKAFGNNHQDINMSAVYDYNTCMAIAGFNDELYFGSQKWIIDNMLSKAYCAITGIGLIMNGVKRNDMHKGFESQWNTKSGRTVIGEDKEGNPMSYSFAGETGKSGMTCAELQDKCLELGFYTAICLDGGGSVFRQYRNNNDELVYDISSSRKVKNALMLYRRKKKDIKPTYDELEQMYIKLQDQCDSVKKAYDILLDSNEELRHMLDQAAGELADSKNELTKVKQEVLGLIDQMKEIVSAE